MLRDSKIKYEIKLILVGDSGVGKTSLLGRYMNEPFTEKKCTIFHDFKIKIINFDSSTQIILTIWDTCGQEKYRSLNKLFFNDVKGIVLMYDVSDKKSFQNLDKWLNDISEHIIKEDVAIVLRGNKIDIKPRNISYEEGYKYAIKNDMLYCETSSKEGINIDIVFENAIKNIIEKINVEKKFEEEIAKNTSISTSLRAVRGKEIREKERNCC